MRQAVRFELKTAFDLTSTAVRLVCASKQLRTTFTYHELRFEYAGDVRMVDAFIGFSD